MPPSHTAHAEHHFTGNHTVRDVVLGVADGLTVPFALAAGLSGALMSSKVVIAAGLAEIAAGTISMGLGGYLAAQSEVEHYAAERVREEREVEEVPEVEAQEVQQILEAYGLHAQESKTVVDALRKRPQAWIDFMMRFELGLEEPAKGRALQSGLTIGGSYAVGGIVPLAPYFFMSSAAAALPVSIAVTFVALLIFGFVKGQHTGAKPAWSAIQTLAIGGMAAAAAYGLAKAVS